MAFFDDYDSLHDWNDNYNSDSGNVNIKFDSNCDEFWCYCGKCHELESQFEVQDDSPDDSPDITQFEVQDVSPDDSPDITQFEAHNPTKQVCQVRVITKRVLDFFIFNHILEKYIFHPEHLRSRQENREYSYFVNFADLCKLQLHKCFHNCFIKIINTSLIFQKQNKNRTKMNIQLCIPRLILTPIINSKVLSRSKIESFLGVILEEYGLPKIRLV